MKSFIYGFEKIAYFWFLSTHLVQVRIEAALSLRTLTEVDPNCVGGLFSYGVTMLTALRENVSYEKVLLPPFILLPNWYC